jgi:hypothetical protein
MIGERGAFDLRKLNFLFSVTPFSGDMEVISVRVGVVFEIEDVCAVEESARLVEDTGVVDLDSLGIRVSENIKVLIFTPNLLRDYRTFPDFAPPSNYILCALFYQVMSSCARTGMLNRLSDVLLTALTNL